MSDDSRSGERIKRVTFAPDGAITASSAPDSDTAIERDLAFHLGERETYDFDSIAEVCRSTSPPDDAFVCFRAKPVELIAGELYARLCRFGPETVEPARSGLVGKHRRTIATINRDLADMHPGIAYAFDFRDARAFRYEEIFGTEKPIPVFQYHRRRGFAAIVHPLQPRHQFPSRYIPRVDDTISFREKRAKIFWRGNLSGTVATPKGTVPLARVLYSRRIADEDKTKFLRASLRFSLSEKSRTCDALDAGLTIKWRSGLFREPLPSLLPLCRPAASIKDQLAYRYLLALDGYDGPSSHYWMLASNSLVLRQESPWEMFGDCYFLRWIHYVPIAADGSDLFDKFEWCERNIERCEKMVANANRAWAILFDEHFQCERRRALLARYAEWAGVKS